MTSYVVIEEVCPKCNGSKMDGPQSCWTCHGTGTVQRRVTCAECANCGPVGDLDHWCCVMSEEVVPSFGCASWEAKP